MSREIKFRLWDGGRKKMFQSDEGLSGSNGFLSIVQIYTGYEDSDDWTKYKLMQFTGMQDKNGADIYEGDILGLNEFWTLGVVEYFAPTWGVSGKKGVCTEFDEKDYGLAEIIGNRYQNPELLKKAA